ncbi:unnamed protein product [Zymoseptoria tritici ST99CH_1E4]|uniref:Nuclear GTPase SLIP-GC n=1 Tax=Zymoseptoria tritici ST99CH_1E4 TaxID=1276532 RepID=A0A2H1H4V3_ZYMTR|nr:unnamed protein product [Zymoseptoria tritici ST99CH_1E4]
MSSALFERARALLPTAVPDYREALSKPSRLYIIIERHNDPCPKDAPATSDNFLWVKGHSKLTVEKVLNAYLANYPDEHPNIVVLDKFGNRALASAMMGELTGGDQLVVLSAREMSGASTAPRADAPHTTTTANMAPPARIERQPLLPANRQLNFTPNKTPGSFKKSTGKIKSSPKLTRPQTEQTQATSSASPSSRTPKMTPTVQDSPARRSTMEASMHENPFLQDQPEAELSTRGIPLRKLAGDVVPERLEAGMQVGLRALAEVEKPLLALKDNADAQAWLKQIENVRCQSQRSRTVVGVVGNTGAGKSSVINALLEEERLVPTNCMRACTAVVTELSYNDSMEPSKKYRAEIEFIKTEDWEKELKVLFAELLDDNGAITREISNPDSEASIAYSKVRSVYNKHTKDMLAKSSVRALMNVKQVKKILGRTIKIQERDPTTFYRRLQGFVDSKEKGTEKLDKNGNINHNAKREFESWPLIKVVRIYVKADALSTGAVIVDLPGVHDSNAARAAVAEGYMKQTSGLWIVAPINRAVDDKAAKNLLGDSFKRQLKFDGTYSAVTFICSKTDDISRTEATDTLKLGASMEELEEKHSNVSAQKRQLTKQLKDSRERKQDLDDIVESLDEQVDVWDELLEKVEHGKTVYAPFEKTGKKRKKGGASERKNKRQRRSSDSDTDERSSQSDDNAEDDENTISLSAEPLTVQVVEEKLDEFKSLKREARKEKREIDERMTELREAIGKLEGEAEAIDAEQSALCITGRNEYSRAAIKQDFAQGIREIDEETAQEEDPENFDPAEEIRDYNEVAESLPVFCVSSRAYQKLSDRLRKDNDVAGFTTVEQTEIPQLQAHCKKLTEKGRQAGCRRFLNSVAQLLTSLELWSSDDGNGVKLTNGQRDTEKSFLQSKLKQLDKSLERVVKETLEETITTLEDQLFAEFHVAAQKGEIEAPLTVAKWNASRAEGGLHHSTYKATVRRAGVYHRDWNGELVEPIYKQLGTLWEKTFQRRLPHILKTFSKCAQSTLKQFHAAVDARCRAKGHGLAQVGRLGQQLTQYAAIFNDIVNTEVGVFNEGQREINREFTPSIMEAMAPVYDGCTSESGKGMFMRMKGLMENHVAVNKSSMFNQAVAAVRTSLLALCDKVRKSLLEKADGIFVSMQRDYLTIIGGIQVDLVRMSPQERSAKREVDMLIEEVDGWFQEIIEADLEKLKSLRSDSDAADGAAGGDNIKEEIDDDDDEAFMVDSDTEDENEDDAEGGSAGNGDTSAEDAEAGSAGHDDRHVEREAMRTDDDEL